MKMKKYSIFFSLFLVYSCLDHVSSEKISYDGKYSVIAKVNRTNKNAEFYAEPIFQLFDSNKTLIKEIESDIGDFSRWEIGWSDSSNILIMYSSDIGNRAWRITDVGIENIELTVELNSEAKELILE